MNVILGSIGVAATLFAVGAYGAITHRNIIRVLISLELMFNSVLILLVVLAATRAPLDGYVLALIVIALTSSEIGVIVSIIVLLFRRLGSTDVTQAKTLKG